MFTQKDRAICSELYNKYYAGRRFHDALYRDMIRKYLEPGQRLLDAGCGRYMKICRELAGVAQVVGIDLESTLETRNQSGPFGIRGDVSRLPFSPESFHVIISRSVVEHLDDPQKVFEEFARVLRPAGWLVFDAHTDAMMALTSSRPIVTGEQEGHRFVILAEVDPDARLCDTRIDVTPDGAASPFSEHHRQYFHRDTDIRSALVDGGFEVVAVRDGYSDRPADESTLSATWIASLRR